jgi:uncharacterized membrane protein YphA (DoxX/SURF4 family)
MKHSLIRYTHAALAIGLALFFINAGLKKFMHRPLRPVDKSLLIENILEKDNYAPPTGYNLTMNTLNQNGFLKLIGVFQILAGLLIIVPPTRLGGLILLLPVVLNIFLLHVFIDDRPHENVETGILLGINLLLLSFYYKTLLALMWRGRNIKNIKN